jgi:hypothetical protein
MWDEAEGRDYARRIGGEALVLSLMTAFVARFSGLREIAARMGIRLGTSNFSSLSHALNRASSLDFVRALVRHLESRHTPGEDELVALDSMAVTLPITQRHRCRKYNKSTAGGGVLWAYRIGAARGTCPVKVIHTMAGSWNDSALMRGVKLLARGPVYLMDRGFWSLDLLEGWNKADVRFIVRAKYNSIYKILAEFSKARAYGKRGRIELDAIVRLGFHGRKKHPVARLIRARVGREYIVLATGEIHWTAEEVLDAYRKRERIEKFHHFVKDTLGLAHLYSFSHTGIMVLLHVALLIALILFLADEATGGETETLTALRQRMMQARAPLGLGHRWRRNTNALKRSSKAKTYKWQEQLNL